MDTLFFLNSMLLGVGLAMDAFSVSLANGLGEPKMRKFKMTATAGTFGFFQGLMPLIGWICVHTIITYFTRVQKVIPVIALILLLYIGINLLVEGIRGSDGDAIRLTPKKLLVQGIATSIDALSVGFTIADHNGAMAFVSALIIASVTFIISFVGILIGRRFGQGLAGKASILGGVILVCIGIEIFVKGVFLQ